MATAQAAGVDLELKQRLQAAVGDNSSFADQYIATVWLTDMALRLERRVEDPEERVQILQYVHEEAARVDLPPELVLAVIDIESAFDRFAVSSAGARGLMQVMPFWLVELEEPDANHPPQPLPDCVWRESVTFVYNHSLILSKPAL